MPNKVPIPGKVEKHKSNPKRFIVRKHHASETDIEVEVTGDGDYEIEKLSLEGLPEKMPDGTLIRWFNNFHVKKNKQIIKEKYFVTIPEGQKGSRLVIVDSKGEPYYYKGEIKNGVIELTDGDPGTGWCP
jgi:hypothetical protein